MKKNRSKKLAAAILCGAMSCSAVLGYMPVVAADTQADAKVIYSTDFEDGDVSAFTNRGENDTTVISSTTDDAVSGSTALLASGRSKDWNGPAFRLDEKCAPYTEYYISFKFKARYYTSGTISFQYDDSDGKTHYSNLIQNINTSDWYTVENLKVSFTDEMSNVFVYVEGGQNDIFIDDFSVTEVPVIPIQDDIPAISKVFADKFKIGTAIMPSNLSSKSFMALVEKHFSGSLTAGNEMKPDSVLNKAACQAYYEETGDDTVPQVSFAAAKPFLNYCQKNNIPVRVHTLVWHSQTPDWFFKEGYADDGDFVSKEKMLQRMENYIKAYFTELTALYPDVDFYACDVVNEAWTNDGKPRDPGEQGQSGSEKSAWVKVFGDNSFIEPAFTFARKYAPEGCKLYYNDYNEYMGKIDTIIEMAKDLNAKGVLDGIGLQSHLDARDKLTSAFPTVEMYDKALAKYAATGLDIQITELDATVDQNDPTKYVDYQKEYYQGIMDAIVKYSDSISAVVFWGVTDDQSWRANRLPLLFDENYQAKPAYYGVVGDREEQEVSTTTKVTTTGTSTTTVVTTTTTTVESSTGELSEECGDSNMDGKVSVADAVAILQHVALNDKYGLKGQALINADCYNPGDGVTPKDALAIQKLDAKVLESLPEIE